MVVAKTVTRLALGWLTLAVCLGYVLAACAAGSSATVDAMPVGPGVEAGPSDGTTPHDGHADGIVINFDGNTLLPIGAPCTSNAQCSAPGACTTLGTAGRFCTEPCPATGCPKGTYCSTLNGVNTCFPDLNQECNFCELDSDCPLPTDACLTMPDGEKFCGMDCTPSGVCPMGYTCETKAALAPPDAGATDGAVDAASDTGMTVMPDAGGPSKWCVPSGGAGCACTMAKDGATAPCSVSNQYGTCVAPSTCNGATGTWVGCPAPATPDICNGLDDDCDGDIDQGDPNTLCGGAPPNATWQCVNAMCILGPCNKGWADFPVTGKGCTCPVNASEPDGTCATASNAGAVQSVGGSPVVINGTLSSATDVNVWAVSTVDTAEPATNSYHVAISFTQPATNTEFVMDVIRGACTDAPTGGVTNITTYDWCVNATSATAGESVCGPTAIHQCADHSSPYFIRVHRKAGATPTCTSYQITVTGGGGTCDLTQTCM